MASLIIKSQSQKISQNSTDEIKSDEKDEIPKYIQIFSKYEFIYCWVEGEALHSDDNVNPADPTKFHADFSLYLRDWPNTCQFDMKYKTLEKYLLYVNEEKPIYFAAQKFPLTSIKRDPSIQTDMDFMAEMMTITERIEYIDDNDTYHCKGPRKTNWWSSKLMEAEDQDIKAMAAILTKLFNSPKLVIDDEDNMFDALEIHLHPNIQQKMRGQANKIWSLFKKETCPEWPMGLEWTPYDIVTGIELVGIKEFEEKEYEAKECRLNNPKQCWKPKMDGNIPYLIINLDTRKTQISKIRVQGSIKSIKVIKWRKSEEKFDDEIVDDEEEEEEENKYEYKVENENEEEFTDIKVNILSRKLKIIPIIDDEEEITMKMELFGALNKNHKLLLGNAMKDIEFEQLYVVYHDGNIGESNINNHWALKFEGKDYLLTVEWLDDNRVKSMIERNTIIGQRRFWYSNHNDNKKLFTSRWGKLYILPITRSESEIAQYGLRGLSAGCIGKLIDSWIRWSGKWDLIENNCQHFVRDILSLFSKYGAQYLAQFMDHIQTNKAIHPLLEVCDQKSGIMRVNNIRKVLLDTFEQYQKEKVLKQQNVSFIVENDDNDDKKSKEKYKVYLWLRDICNLSEYYRAFIKAGFDRLDIIKLLTDHNLESINVKLGHRNYILSKAKEIQ